MKLQIIMPLIYIFAGIMHFIRPIVYIRIMPSYMPYQKELVYISGFLEILFGVMLLFDNTKVLGAWLLIVLLFLVFPANIQMAVNMYKSNSSYLWLAILRLPLQFLLIWWAYTYTQ